MILVITWLHKFHIWFHLYLSSISHSLSGALAEKSAKGEDWFPLNLIKWMRERPGFKVWGHTARLTNWYQSFLKIWLFHTSFFALPRDQRGVTNVKKCMPVTWKMGQKVGYSWIICYIDNLGSQVSSGLVFTMCGNPNNFNLIDALLQLFFSFCLPTTIILQKR